MPNIIFPPIETADEQGLLAIGGNLEPETLLSAYTQGIFPWPISSEYPLTWFSPDPRGVLLFENLHIPRSLKKFLKKTPYTFALNQNFETVIRMCKDIKNRTDGTDTWITNDIVEAYTELFHMGFAYSAETYLDGRLVGGLYGVQINSFISGESMFYLKPNASKFALIQLIEFLKKQGVSWIDTQMVTPVVEALGGTEIERSSFLSLLNQSLQDI